MSPQFGKDYILNLTTSWLSSNKKRTFLQTQIRSLLFPPVSITMQYLANTFVQLPCTLYEILCEIQSADRFMKNSPSNYGLHQEELRRMIRIGILLSMNSRSAPS